MIFLSFFSLTIFFLHNFSSLFFFELFAPSATESETGLLRLPQATPSDGAPAGANPFAALFNPDMVGAGGAQTGAAAAATAQTFAESLRQILGQVRASSPIVALPGDDVIGSLMIWVS